jgi:hypothetical protein
MKPGGKQDRRADENTREFRPKLDREVSRRLDQIALEVEERIDQEQNLLRLRSMAQGLAAQRAHDTVWELVRERYIFLPQES